MDRIILFTTPVSLGLLGCFYKFIFGSKLIINVQDFQAEAASSLKMVKGKTLVKLLTTIENLTYRYADLVTSISKSMLKILNQKEPKIKKSFLWPNWIDCTKETIVDTSFSFRVNHNIHPDCKIIAYAGNIGLKQGLEIFAELAKRFINNKLIYFIV